MMGTTAMGRGPKAVRAAKVANEAYGTTYYIDSVAGKNGNLGTSQDAPWKDFTNINGRTLAAGERLLIKRGSVINQELRVSAHGTADHWVEIGAYGEGPRAIIRRNWNIGDRCAFISDPDYLRIRSLVVGYAGKGLVVYFSNPEHGHLLIEDCIGHHIEGLYVGSDNCNGVPEWRNYPVPEDDGLDASAGIAVTGKGHDITLRDCEFFQNSWGFLVMGERITVNRVYTHDDYVFNSSPGPAMISVKDSTLENSIFDASGWVAPFGTTGIMLERLQDITIRNCTFRNQPDAGTTDECAIDLESRGDGCVIDNCTFEHQAGAAIEVLGLEHPQTRNIEIRNSRFLQDNYAKLLGPNGANYEGPTPRGEIFVWGSGAVDPKISCSNGTIHDNAYVLHPGVEFFVNNAPATTHWSLQNNTSYATVEELEKAVSFNKPPVVSAGPDVITNHRRVRLSGSVRDDGKPAGGKLRVKWEMVEGSGNVKFEDDSDANTLATFPQAGDYWLRLVGDDGELWTSDSVIVRILKPGVTVVKNWDFNTALDKEGWTEVNLGTKEREEPNGKGGVHCKSCPVKYVAGGYYIVSVENSADAHLLSADGLNVRISKHKTIRVRFQNHTSATRMRFRFITDADPNWDDAKSQSFDAVANDDGPRVYTVDMSRIPGWKGTLRQLRFDLADGSKVTGTCRIDYIRIDNSNPVAE